MLDEFERVSRRRCTYHAPSIDLISNVTGQPIGARTLNAALLARARARAGAVRAGHAGAGRRAAARRASRSAASDAARHGAAVRRRRCDACGCRRCGAAATTGRRCSTASRRCTPRASTIDWAAFDAPYRRRKLVLPTYPFQRERYWVGRDRPRRASSPTPPLHPLLGWEVMQAASERSRVRDARSARPASPGWRTIASSADRCCCLRRCTWRWRWPPPRRSSATAPLQIDDLTLHQALPLDADDARTVQLVLAPPQPATSPSSASVRSMTETRRWDTCASWTCGSFAATRVPPPADLQAIRARTTESISVPALLRVAGLARARVRPALSRRRRRSLRRRSAGADAAAGGAAGAERRTLRLHPALLDACFHVVGAALPGAGASSAMPSCCCRSNGSGCSVRWASAPGPMSPCTPTIGRDLATRETFRADLRLLDDEGRVIATSRACISSAPSVAALDRRNLPARVRDMLHELVWRPVPVGDEALPRPRELPTEVASRAERAGRAPRPRSLRRFRAGARSARLGLHRSGAAAARLRVHARAKHRSRAR